MHRRKGHSLVVHGGLRQPLGEKQRLAELQGETDMNQPMHVTCSRVASSRKCQWAVRVISLLPRCLP